MPILVPQPHAEFVYYATLRRNHKVRKRRMFVGTLNTPFNGRFHVSSMHALARGVDTRTTGF